MAKKRYVGFMYETPDDKEPVFDAKGIETVRRDGVPAQQKMTETCLKLVSTLNICAISTVFVIGFFFGHRISVK
jgi:DNA polymerase elongation subunit (family B)